MKKLAFIKQFTFAELNKVNISIHYINPIHTYREWKS